MWTQRLKETGAMMMIGDGLLALSDPHRHCLLWKAGPRAWQEAVETFVEHPQITRVLGAVEVGLGFWIASRQQPQAPARAMDRLGSSVRSTARRAMAVH
jgi:hypothetical protein